MSQKQYPVLYTTKTKGTFFKHCSINPTLYFEMIKDEERAKTDADYNLYMDAMVDECYDALIHKFITSQPLKVTNDKIPFLIFKSNVDMRVVKMFCQAILDEVYESTGTDHQAKYLELKTLFMQMDKEPSPFKAGKVGEKLTQSSIFHDQLQILEGSHKKIDSGIITPFKEYILLKQENAQNKSDSNEDIVEW